jgi:fibronectin-binding autotransporter adhesin
MYDNTGVRCTNPSSCGSQSFSGTNTYTGTTTISGGTFIISGSGSLGSGNYSANITNNGLFKYSSSTNQTLSGVISGSGALTKDTNASTLTLSGANTYTGATTISAGTLTVSGTLADTTAVTVASGTTYNVNATDTIGSLAGAGTVQTNGTVTLTSGGDSTSTTFSGVIQNGTGTLSLTKSGTGKLTLTGNNTYTGATTISAGTLQLGDGTSLTGSLSTSGITNNSALIYDSSSDQTISYVISGTGTVEVVARQRVLSFSGNSYLLTTAQTLLENSTVAEIYGRITGGNMNGQSVSGSTPAGAYNGETFSQTNTLTGQLQFFDGSFTKVVFVKFQQNGNNVEALSYAGNNGYHTVYGLR